MGRWEPDARGRLEKAAMELFHERGYARTTAEEIAARAGLTERTFFRYFTDKREVLFSGSKALEKFILDGIASAPQSTAPLEAVTAALEATAAFFDSRRSFARKRQALIAADAELQEREVMKLSSLASAVAESLRKRGIPAPTASLAAEAGIAIFKVAFEHWVKDEEQRDFTRHVRAARRELEAVAAGGRRRHSRPRL
jgi:AcrR family transcriptional regulator